MEKNVVYWKEILRKYEDELEDEAPGMWEWSLVSEFVKHTKDFIAILGNK